MQRSFEEWLRGKTLEEPAGSSHTVTGVPLGLPIVPKESFLPVPGSPQKSLPAETAMPGDVSGEPEEPPVPSPSEPETTVSRTDALFPSVRAGEILREEQDEDETESIPSPEIDVSPSVRETPREEPVRRYVPPVDVVSDVEQQFLTDQDAIDETRARRTRRIFVALLLFCAVAGAGYWWGTRMTADELNSRGVVLLDSGKPDEALQIFRKAEKKSPDSLPVLLNIAKSLERLGRQGEAVDAYFRCLQVAPSNPEIHLRLGTLFRALASPEKAIRSFQDVLQADPENAQALLGLGLSYLDRDDAAQAVPVLERALGAGADATECNAALGKARMALEEQRRIHEAQKARERALETVERGRVSQMLARYEEAESHFEEALKLDPENEIAQLALAGLLRKVGRFSRARELYEKVLMKSPEHQEARSGLMETLRLEVVGDRPASPDADIRENRKETKPTHAPTRSPSRRGSSQRRSGRGSTEGSGGMGGAFTDVPAPTRRTPPAGDPLERFFAVPGTTAANAERPTFRHFPFPLGEYAPRRLPLPDSVPFRPSPVVFPYLLAVSSLQQAVSINPDGQKLYLEIIRNRGRAAAGSGRGGVLNSLLPEEEGLYSLFLAHALRSAGSHESADEVLRNARRFFPGDARSRMVVRYLSGS